MAKRIKMRERVEQEIFWIGSEGAKGPNLGFFYMSTTKKTLVK